MCRKSKSKRASLGCWTSAIEADVYRTGELVSKRMDVLISRDFSVSKGTSISLLRNRLHFPCCQPSSRYCSYFVATATVGPNSCLSTAVLFL